MSRPDPPCTPASVELAKVSNAVERVRAAQLLIDLGARDLVDRLGLLMPVQLTPEQVHRMDAIEAFAMLIHEFGTERIHRWLVNLAKAEDLTLPCGKDGR